MQIKICKFKIKSHCKYEILSCRFKSSAIINAYFVQNVHVVLENNTRRPIIVQKH